MKIYNQNYTRIKSFFQSLDRADASKLSLVLSIPFFFIGIVTAKLPSNSPIWLFIINNLISIGLFVVLFLTFVRASKKTLSAITSIKAGFRKIEEEEAFRELKKCVESADRNIRIIGDAFNNASNTAHQNLIKEYLETIYNKCKAVSNLDFKYQRITTFQINKGSHLEKHLQACVKLNALTRGKKPKTPCEFAFLPFFDHAYTYIIVDDDFLIMHVPNVDQTQEYESNLICNNVELIAPFIKHFEDNWNNQKERIIESKKALHFELNRRRKLWEKIYLLDEALHHQSGEELCNCISSALDHGYKAASGINKFRKEHFNNINQNNRFLLKTSDSVNRSSKNSYLSKFAKNEIRQTYNRLKLLGDGEINIDHSNSNGRVVNVFLNALRDLDSPSEYRTISVNSFWKIVTSNDRSDFLTLNKNLVQKKVKITRYYVIKRTDLLSESKVLNKDILDQLRIHQKLMRDFPKFYYFKFCILDDDYYLQKQWNAAHIIINREIGSSNKNRNKKKAKFETKEEILIKINHNNSSSNPLRDVKSEIYSWSEDEIALGKNNAAYQTYSMNLKEVAEICEKQKNKDPLYSEVVKAISSIV